MSVCNYIQAAAGDGCWALANRCKISEANLNKYNPSLCVNPIFPDQYVCCSAGSLPDFSPKPDEDGNCFVYVVQKDEVCSKIAKDNHIDDWKKIEEWNKFTWGFSSCGNLQEKASICLSKGDPPFPASVEGHKCGPQVCESY